MKTWIKRTLVGVFGAAVLFTGFAAWSHQGGRCFGGGHAMTEADIGKMKQRLVERATSYLDLDAAQQQRLSVLADQLQAGRAAVRGSTDPRAELQGLVAGNAFDRAKALSLLEAKTQAVGAQGPAAINALADFYDALRPDQQDKLRALMNRRHGG